MNSKDKDSNQSFVIEGANPLVRRLGWKKLPKDKRKLAQDLNKLRGLKIDPEIWKKATSFQREVWEACTLIPEGSVATYGDIASAIGRPRAVRAVARALGSNPVAILIPCHRVISSQGLGGYTCPFGLEAKESILELELN